MVVKEFVDVVIVYFKLFGFGLNYGLFVGDFYCYYCIGCFIDNVLNY